MSGDAASALITLVLLHDRLVPLAHPAACVAYLVVAGVWWRVRPAPRGQFRAVVGGVGLIAFLVLWPRTVSEDGVQTLVRQVQLALVAPGLFVLALPWVSPWRWGRTSHQVRGKVTVLDEQSGKRERSQ